MSFVISFLCCLVPSLALFFWVRSLQKDKPGYTAGCKSALINGFISVGPVLGMGLVFAIVGSLLGFTDRSTVTGAIYRCFAIFALTEELSKFLLFRHTLKKTTCDVSWFDAAVFMTLVGVGFGIFENIFYAFEMGLGQSIIRGLAIAHGGYGFIMGYFFAKAAKTGKKGYYLVAFLLPYIMHGLYDLSLSSVFADNDLFIFLALALAVADYVIIIIAIVFFARRKRNEKYTSSLGLKMAADAELMGEGTAESGVAAGAERVAEAPAVEFSSPDSSR